MMAIYIKNIKINRGGPLKEDFVFEAGNVNLIYGHNETGKTYLVESMINLLFRTGKKASINWELRGWDSGGIITLSGLKDETVSFTKAGKKIEDYWEEDIGLPQDFSHLLVVKAGETLLSHEVDGVGRDILKNYLSGVGLLDEIERAISTTIQKSRAENGEIFGPNQGEIRKREQCKYELDRIDSLLKEAEETYASSDLYILRRKQEALKEDLALQNKAKCYYAGCKHKSREEFQRDIEGLPAEDELSDIESNISVYENSSGVIEGKLVNLSKMDNATDDYLWTEKALGIYLELMAKAVAPPKSIPIFLMFLALFGTIITGIMNLMIPFIICVASLFVFLVYYIYRMRKTIPLLGNELELNKLNQEYKTRFNEDLKDRAALEVRLDSLKEKYISSRDLRKDLDENLIPILKASENNLKMRLKTITDTDTPKQEWRPVISEIKTTLNKLRDEKTSLDLELASLAIPEEDLLDQDPGIAWNSKTNDALNNELQDNSDLLEQALQKLEQLKSRVSQETNVESNDWEQLITALQQKRDTTAQYYKQITAEILAKIQVFNIVQEYREEENARISSGLEREELTKPLYAITGRYKRIRHEVESGLVLTTDDENEYPLSTISTGAREQVFLALRMGFSSIAMKGNSAFLILDDAFQHSDWPHRENIVPHIIGLGRNGWQIFYFTMDDHIKDLFLKHKADLGANFKYAELV